MKAIFSIFLMVALSGLALSGQAPEKRFVGNCSFSGFALLSDSTYRGDIVNFTDRFGDGYNLNQLAAGYEILDGRGLVFEVDTIHSATNFTADVSVTAKVDRGFAPFGSGQAYSPTENGLIPPSSQEQAGLSPTQKARVDRHNVVVMQSLIGGRDSVYSIASVPDTSGLSPVLGDAFVNATADTLGLYDGAGWVLFFGGSQSADGFTILGDGTGGDPFRVNTDSLHTKMVSMDGPLIHYLNPCEANIDLSLSGTLFYDSIRIGDNLSGLITEDDEVPFVVVGITEWPGYATFTLFASNVVPGVYFPGIYYAGELLWSDQVTVVAGSTDTVTVFDPPGQDSILVTRVCGTEISRDTIPLADVLPSDNVTGTGTTNRIPLWAGVQELGDSYLLQSADALTLDASKVFQFAGHTTAGRPTATLGFSGYNTTAGWFEGSNGTDWWYFPRTSQAGGLFTPGSLAFAVADGGLGQNNANLFWDNSLIRLGIGTNSPSQLVHVYSSLNAPTGFRAQNISSGISAYATYQLVNDAGILAAFFLNGSGNTAYGGANSFNMVSTHASGKLTLCTNNLPRLTIAASGPIGVGVSAPTARFHLPGGTIAASTAPVKYTSGALMTAPEVGAVEFLTDRWYGTITTGTARETFAFLKDVTAVTTGLATNDVPRWNGTALAPSGITSDGALIAIVQDDINMETTQDFQLDIGDAGYINAATILEIGTGSATSITLSPGSVDILEDDVQIASINALSLSGDEEVDIGSTNNEISIDANLDMFIQSSTASVSISGAVTAAMYGDEYSQVGITDETALYIDRVANTATLGDYSETTNATNVRVDDVAEEVLIGKLSAGALAANQGASFTPGTAVFYDESLNAPNMLETSSTQPWNVVMTAAGELRKDTVYGRIFGMLYGTLDSIVTTGATDFDPVAGWNGSGDNSGHFTYTDSSAIYSGPTHRLRVDFNARLIGGLLGDAQIQIGYSITAGSGTLVQPVGQTKKITLRGGTARDDFNSTCFMQVADGYEIKCRGGGINGGFGIQEARLTITQID